MMSSSTFMTAYPFLGFCYLGMDSGMEEVGMEPRMVLLPDKILPCLIKATWDNYGENMGLNQILFKGGQIGFQIEFRTATLVAPFLQSALLVEPLLYYAAESNSPTSNYDAR